jgi:hypothetical protein
MLRRVSEFKAGVLNQAHCLSRFRTPSDTDFDIVRVTGSAGQSALNPNV